jgi:hypothetical protein
VDPAASDPRNGQVSDAHSKALAVNLDATIYGTFAEIGAGQEVANWFLRVGAASGTVAQTICAYDKNFSDERYGKGTRYVSKERLQAMLDCEFASLAGQLAQQRPAKRRFFTFADTVAARSFKGDNEQHGWVGLRFEIEPGGPANEVLLHVGLHDGTAERQQEALGVLGVNLIYAAYHQAGSAESFLTGLFEGLSIERLEIDVIELNGPLFAWVDSRSWCLQALRRSMGHAVVFDDTGQPVEPATALRKRPLLIERGRFEVIAEYQSQMLRSAALKLRSEDGDRDPVPVLEMTVKDVNEVPPLRDSEILQRIDRLTKLGTVMVSNLGPYYLLMDYLRRYTSEPIRVVVGSPALAHLLGEQFYSALPGALLEGLGKLFAANVKVYVYPVPVDVFRTALGGEASSRMIHPETTGLVSSDDLRPEPPLDLLLSYLRAAGWIVPLVPAS